MSKLLFAVLLFFNLFFQTPRLDANELTPQQNQKLNVLLIISDDQGYGDFGFTGNSNVKTPHLDQLSNTNGIIYRAQSSVVRGFGGTSASLDTV